MIGTLYTKKSIYNNGTMYKRSMLISHLADPDHIHHKIHIVKPSFHSPIKPCFATMRQVFNFLKKITIKSG